MLRFRKIRWFCIALLLSAAPAHAIGSVTVMADTSAGIAIAEIARDYSRARQVVVNTSFALPKAQEAQITEGGAADILITRDQPWIEQLKTQGLVDIYSQTLVARNQLALVGPVGSPLKIDWKTIFPVADFIQAMGGEPNLLVGNPETLAEGIYGKDALRSLGIADDLEPYTLYIKRRSDMFDMVRQHGSYGLFFYSSALGQPGTQVIGVLPEATHKPIQYYAVVIAGENMDEARKFMSYLKSPAARKILRDSGFEVD